MTTRRAAALAGLLAVVATLHGGLAAGFAAGRAGEPRPGEDATSTPTPTPTPMQPVRVSVAVLAAPSEPPAPPRPARAPTPAAADRLRGAASAASAASSSAASSPAASAASAEPASSAASGGDAAVEAPLPTYRTRVPSAAHVTYRLSRSGLSGTGELDWRPEAGGYTLSLEGRLPIVGTLITQTSTGRFDAAGLAPERYTDKRLRRGEQAANFQRSAGLISFSGQNPELPITPGVQDRVSVMVQLAAIAAGWARPPPVGEHFRIRVVGARGDSHVWSMRYEGPQALVVAGATVAALHFSREPDGPNDTSAEFWLDPAHQHLPVRVRLADGNGDALELLRQP